MTEVSIRVEEKPFLAFYKDITNIEVERVIDKKDYEVSPYLVTINGSEDVQYQFDPETWVFCRDFNDMSAIEKQLAEDLLAKKENPDYEINKKKHYMRVPYKLLTGNIDLPTDLTDKVKDIIIKNNI